MRISRIIIFAAAGMIFAGSGAQACDWMHTATTATANAEQKVAMSEARLPAASLVSRQGTTAVAACVGEKCPPAADPSATKSAFTR